MFQMILEKLLQATGRTTYTMIMQITGAVVNIILDPILIFGYFGFPAMGANGAAIATVFAQIVSMVLGVVFNLLKNKEIELPPGSLPLISDISKRSAQSGFLR
jgi:Na+-driven multidrug efflux pump